MKAAITSANPFIPMLTNSPRGIWKVIAPTMRRIAPSAANGVSRVCILVRPGKINPAAAANSAVPGEQGDAGASDMPASQTAVG